MGHVSPDSDGDRIWIFFLYGYCLGVFGPTMVLAILELLQYVNLVPSTTEKVFLITCFVTILLPVLIILSYRWYATRKLFAKVLLYAAVLLSAGTIHFFVRATGGPTESFYTFHYLYIPVLATIAFPVRAGI